MSQAEPLFYHAGMSQPLTSEEAKALLGSGKPHEVHLKTPMGKITLAVCPGHTVEVVFHDPYRRRIWPVMWRVADYADQSRKPTGEEPMELGMMAGCCHVEEVPDPTRVSERLWYSFLTGQGGGKYVARYTNPGVWDGEHPIVEHSLPHAVLPAPGIAGWEAYVSFDYSPFEEALQDFPESLYPQGLPRRNPGTREWLGRD